MFDSHFPSHLHRVATDEAKAEIRSAACRYCAGLETESTMGSERLTRHDASLSRSGGRVIKAADCKSV